MNSITPPIGAYGPEHLRIRSYGTNRPRLVHSSWSCMYCSHFFCHCRLIQHSTVDSQSVAKPLFISGLPRISSNSRLVAHTITYNHYCFTRHVLFPIREAGPRTQASTAPLSLISLIAVAVSDGTCASSDGFYIASTRSVLNCPCMIVRLLLPQLLY